MVNGKIHYKWPFSIAMINYQRVIIMPDELYGLYGLIQMDYHYLADELSFS